MADASRGLSAAGDAALAELLNDFRVEVVSRAATFAEGSTISASDVVRAYYELMPSTDADPAREGQIARSVRLRRLAITTTVASALVVVVGTMLIAFGLRSGGGGAAPLAIVGSVYVVAGVVGAVLVTTRMRRLKRRESAVQAAIDWNEGEGIVSDVNGAASPAGRSYDHVNSRIASEGFFLARWLDIESEIRSLHSAVFDSGASTARRPFGGLVNDLRSAGALSDDLHGKIVSLLKARNALVHGGEVSTDARTLGRDLDFVSHELTRLGAQKFL